MLCKKVSHVFTAALFVGLTFSAVARGAFNEVDRSFGVSADDRGNVYIAGGTTGSLGGANPGGNDAFVSQFDAAGNLQWTRQSGTEGYDVSLGVSADGLGNVYIGGSTPGSGSFDPFLSKYDAAGTLQWTTRLDPHYATGRSVSADGLGNVHISGTFEDNAGHTYAFVNMYNAAGNLLWTRLLGTGSYDISLGASADGLGNVYISGSTHGNLGGPNAGPSDAFVAKYDVEGNLEWTRQLGTSLSEESTGVSADGLGNVYISGYIHGLAGPIDAFVTKYDAAGNLQWTRQLGSHVSHGVSADGRGNVYITGFTGGPDAFLSKYDAAGDLLWTRQLGYPFGSESQGVSADGLGNVYISGTLNSRNAFVAKYDEQGNHQWTAQLRDIPEPASSVLVVLAGLALLGHCGRSRCRNQLSA
jgi:hypothetical protein